EVGEDSGIGEIQALVTHAVHGRDEFIGLRFVGRDGTTIEAGDIPADAGRSPPSLAGDRLVLTHPVMRNGVQQGMLIGNFDLTNLRQRTALFREQLLESERERRRASFLWILASMAVMLLLCGAVVWLISSAQNRRIREIKIQAEKLSDANFGEPLKGPQGDELSDLIDVFNAMRDKLRRTTISRDYVDSILGGMNEAIIVTSADGTISRVNAATARMLDYQQEELIGQPIGLILDKHSAELKTDTPSGVPREAAFLTKHNESIPISYTGSIIGDDEQTADRIYAAQNITERRKTEQRIRYLARIDALTKVPNRMQFQHLLQRAIARAKRAGRTLGLLYIDVDHFKEINDTFGHLAGDTTLETVAERLRNALPDETVVGRLAGDEFAVIVDRIDAHSDAASELDALARKLLDRLADPFYVQGHEVFMTASMGIACYPGDAPNVIDLIRNADAALYHAKKAGGNVFSYYRPEMNEAAVERLMTKSKLKRAFERDELLVHYQPKYNLETGHVVGAEALVRWELPERGIILPSDFIPIAEETNLIVEIGEWVLDRVCEDFRYWQRSVSSPGRVSVNLSLKQLRQQNFISRISGILRSYEVSPTSLELEITETTLMENPTRTIKLLDELYALGLHLAIDDFGTGYSSLSALQQFPISTLKIDKSFVRDVAINPDDATIVGTIIHMGRNLKMDVVAEGVETEEQLNFLQSLRCTYAQGLLFGDPMSSDNFLELLLAQAEGTDKYRALFA
ncbi:MAG TPA: EAL domain-containing protein, partial [Woeseiaceae bacterium]|nr:EAL domain-containing protein [Woeseiaceae bacterium]